MDIATFMRQRHRDLHERFLPNLQDVLTEAELRRRPVEGLQPIVWLIWHIARVEDMGLSRFIWEKPQLYDADWRKRMNTSLTHYGTSMSEEEVMAFAEIVDVPTLFEYQKAASDRTVEELKSLDTDKLDEVLDEATVRRIIVDEGLASEKAHWVMPHYIGKTRGWILCHMGLTHNFRHFGQIALARKLLEAQREGVAHG